MITSAIPFARKQKDTIGFLLKGWICLPSSAHTSFNGDFRHSAAVSLFRLHIAPAGSTGILTGSAIAFAYRLRLRTRLTPG